MTRHLGWKLGSLAAAIALWLAVEGAPELVTTQTVPLLYRNLASGLILASDTPESVRAELRGTSIKLTQSALSEVSVSLDLSDLAGPGERTYTLARSNFALPQGISVVRVVPSQVRLIADRMAVKEVPVKIRTTGTPPAGFQVTGQQLIPDRLRISGPETRVNQVDSAPTDPIDLSSMTQKSVVNVNAYLSDARVQFESSPMVTVTLTLERKENR